MGKYFGTDGFRGEANVDLTVEHAYKVGRFLGWYYGQKTPDERCRVVIGKDTRRSSYMFEYSLVAGLTASGADVYLLHVTTTPSVSYVVRTEGFNCGIMISASHNPFYDNGIKVINEKGEKLEESVILEVEKYLDGEMGEIPLAKREHIGRTVDFAAGRNRYIGYLISIATRSFKNMKVALDCSNGSASAIAKNVFDALGAETHVMNNGPNGLNINTDCGSTHIEHLQKFVLQEGCDVGFAYDGDADRCLAVDHEGNLIDGDKIMGALAVNARDRGALANDTLVVTVMSNLGLILAMREAGIKTVQTGVGDRYVLEEMLASGYSLGGEQSGHIIARDHATTGDGILSSLLISRMVKDSGRSLADLTSFVQRLPQTLINVGGVDRAAASTNQAVADAVAAAEARLGDTGRVLLRPSGTEPLVRVMVEAATQEEADSVASSLADVVKEHLAL